MAGNAVGIVPQALRPRDTIAFISPSSRLNRIFPVRVYRAKDALEKLGFRVKIFFDERPTRTFHEAVLERCSEIHNAFLDPEVKAIICTIGGLSANELLPHLDYDLVRANPKIFCGYSDITLLHHAFFTQAGLQTFYGPAAITQLGEFPKPLDFTMNHFQGVLQNPGKPIGALPRSIEWTEEFCDWGGDEEAVRPRTLQPSKGWQWLRQGKATGRLMGGCLPSMLQLAGSKYFPSYRGCILFLENPEGEVSNGPLPFEFTRSLMADIVNLGILGEVTGLVIGRPYKYGDEAKLEEFRQMVLDQCHGTDFPILFNVDIGHTDPLLTIPINAMASLDSEMDEFAILEAGVAERSGK
ncbi:carboxypeptidase [Hyphodiscus hymeniophilus]|uniref:Carboxypeptidase n=1 Tax=Hyphodiscus hymeniophilus TaxID=353542 RepID=A0A9P7AX32_9HELO|nr:carboxypeptidase [Hyphodiscus hymeniophilus]